MFADGDDEGGGKSGLSDLCAICEGGVIKGGKKIGGGMYIALCIIKGNKCTRRVDPGHGTSVIYIPIMRMYMHSYAYLDLERWWSWWWDQSYQEVHQPGSPLMSSRYLWIIVIDCCIILCGFIFWENMRHNVVMYQLKIIHNKYMKVAVRYQKPNLLNNYSGSIEDILFGN